MNANTTTSSTLTRALLWRARREGFASIFVMPLILALVFSGLTIYTAWRANLARVVVPLGGVVLGVHVPAGNGGQVMSLTLMPAIFLIGLGMGGGLLVQAMLGSEVTSGSFELWLSRLSPRQMATSLLRTALTGLAMVWCFLLVLVCVLWGVLHLSPAGAPSFTVAYLALVLLLPVALGVAGVSAAVGVTLFNPKLASITARGIAHGTGSVITLIAILPQVIMLFIVIFLGRTGVSIWLIGGIGLALAVILAGIAVYLGATKLSRDQIVSSL